MQEAWVRSLGQEGPLEKDMATCSSIPAWEIPWAALVGYNPRGRKRNRHDLAIKQQMFVAVLSMSRECMFFDFLSRHNKDLE